MSFRGVRQPRDEEESRKRSTFGERFLAPLRIVDLRSEPNGDTNAYLSGSRIKAKPRLALAPPSLSGGLHFRSHRRLMDSCELWCHTLRGMGPVISVILTEPPRNVGITSACTDWTGYVEINGPTRRLFNHLEVRLGLAGKFNLPST